MRKVIKTTIVTLFLAVAVNAHDEGHGPKISDSGKYGGVLSGVIAKADEDKGSKAKNLHKAELVRSSDGTVRLYVYEVGMKAADLKSFDLKATGSVFSGKGKKKKVEFNLEQKEGVFVGNLPKALTPPYDVEVNLKKGQNELLTAFANLD